MQKCYKVIMEACKACLGWLKTNVQMTLQNYFLYKHMYIIIGQKDNYSIIHVSPLLANCNDKYIFLH